MAEVHYDKEFCKLILMILLIPVLALYFVWNAMEEKEWQRRAKAREARLHSIHSIDEMHDSWTWPDIEIALAEKKDIVQKMNPVKPPTRPMTRQMTRQASLISIKQQ